MNAKQRIYEISEKALDAEYAEQKHTDDYSTLCELRREFVAMRSDLSEKSSEVNYLMVEVESLKAMVQELATIIDETHVPSNEKRINDLTKAYWTTIDDHTERLDDLHDQVNRCTNESCQK